MKKALENFFDNYTYDYELISDTGAFPLPGDLSLEIPFYKQLKTYTCGFVAGSMIVHAFDKRKSFSTIWEMLTPTSKDGLPTENLMKGLRKLKVGVQKRHHLSFKQVSNALDKGNPIMVSVLAKGCEHWVVIYGYNEERKEILIAGNGLVPVFNRHRYSWDEFKEIEGTDEEFLICWGK